MRVFVISTDGVLSQEHQRVLEQLAQMDNQPFALYEIEPTELTPHAAFQHAAHELTSFVCGPRYGGVVALPGWSQRRENYILLDIAEFMGLTFFHPQTFKAISRKEVEQIEEAGC